MGHLETLGKCMFESLSLRHWAISADLTPSQNIEKFS